MSSPNRFWIAGAVVAAALSAALVASIQASALDYVEVTALVEGAARYRGRAVKLTGKVVPATTTVGLDETGKSTLTFQVADERGGRIAVFHRGPKPDAFRDGGVVLLEGALEPTGMRFTAHTLLAQCPSRYEEELAQHRSGGTSGGTTAGADAPRRPGAP